MENLIIVESPTKARTLSRFLGDKYKIEASMGHVRDLPKSKIGVDVENNFEPQYVIPRDKRKIVERLKDVAGKVGKVILATDPDREGEAIAWHVSQIAESKKQKLDKFNRIVFHEITKEAVESALKNPRTIDLKLVDAQQARRILDRLVGYKLSPLLWFKVRRGLSAGRVQSVALRLIVEREREIEAFKPEEYWSIEALLRKVSKVAKGSKVAQDKESFSAFLVQRDGEKIEIKNKKEADSIVKDLESSEYKVEKVEKREVKRSPYPPYTTSTLTQNAANHFGWTSKKTMKIAQDLYEEGLITYHRTDSFNIAQTAIEAVRGFIQETYGNKYLPVKPNFYKTKSKVAQEAHESIRPTNVRVQTSDSKDQKAGISEDLGRDHHKLYEMVWKRFVSCQMSNALFEQTSVDIKAKVYLFRATGSEVIFDGWLRVGNGLKVIGDSEEEKEGQKLPTLTVDEILDLLELLPDQHFTEPPPRYTEASLIKTLEKYGIGRPSTYAPIISTILERQYVEKENRAILPTPIGVAVSDFLVKNFPKVIEVKFTARMEDNLDEIADGKKEWVPVIKEFYVPFSAHLAQVSKEADRVKIEVEKTDEKCDQGHALVVRYGPYGKFLACEKYPEHKFTKPFETEEWKKKEEELEKLKMKCPKCGSEVVLKKSRRGRIFYGCSSYPKCKWGSWKLPSPPVDNKPIV
ncbi:MAG: DNA topoisomerase I [Candidatus Woykebacteria bacterium RBG_13_40_7b]|uniref:DNA topoisomerase 1 n=1 Tax=Candidatus Woykebacteria bacterium RBG_13_40_7b TaxID=1802594 RepID=A0A1G1WAY1_9BACT|nr:MAG: DNA topoisomerase I [Candidatus Woykebacteria bacterium RBG_13_40_7b]